MAKISKVDYVAIPKQAKAMRADAQSINTELTNAYKSIEDMHRSWYGDRYKSLVKEFNNIIPEINELLQLIVKEIPFALETVANNYSQADKGTNATSATQTEPKKINKLSLPNDVGMRFITNDVTSVKGKVSTNFSNAKNKMDSIEATFNRITWESEAADTFKTKFKKLKASIVRSFEELKSQFEKLMNQTLQDMQSTEKANTVS